MGFAVEDVECCSWNSIRQPRGGFEQPNVWRTRSLGEVVEWVASDWIGEVPKVQRPVWRSPEFLLFDVDHLGALPDVLAAEFSFMWRSASGGLHAGRRCLPFRDALTYRATWLAFVNESGLAEWCDLDGVKFGDRKDANGVLFVGSCDAPMLQDLPLFGHVAAPVLPDPPNPLLSAGVQKLGRTERMLYELAAWRCDDRESWRDVLFAVSHCHGEAGRSIARDWSARSPKFDAAEFEKQFDWALGNNPSPAVTIRSLQMMVNQDRG